MSIDRILFRVNIPGKNGNTQEKRKEKSKNMVKVTQNGKEIEDMSQIKLPEDVVKIIMEGLKD